MAKVAIVDIIESMPSNRGCLFSSGSGGVSLKGPGVSSGLGDLSAYPSCRWLLIFLGDA